LRSAIANEAGTKVKAKVDRGTSLLSEAQAELELETSARQFEERCTKDHAFAAGDYTASQRLLPTTKLEGAAIGWKLT